MPITALMLDVREKVHPWFYLYQIIYLLSKI